MSVSASAAWMSGIVETHALISFVVEVSFPETFENLHVVHTVN